MTESLGRTGGFMTDFVDSDIIFERQSNASNSRRP